MSDREPAPADPTAARSESPEPGDGLPEGAVRVRLRRAPRYRPFALTGAVVGALLMLVVALVFGTSDGRFSETTLVGYLVAIGLLVGGLLGATAAVLAERRRN